MCWDACYRRSDVGARNERHLLACSYNLRDEFEIVHGLLDRIMKLLGADPDPGVYEIEPQHPEEEHSAEKKRGPFFPGRHGKVLLFGRKVGTLGVVHPDVLSRFGLNCPVSVVEINIEPLLSGGQLGLQSAA